MQFDQTTVVIRQRSHGDLLDLALLMIRAHVRPLAAYWLAGVVPAMLFNAALIGWIAEVGGGDSSGARVDAVVQYGLCMVLLVFVQAPSVTCLMTIYLGKAVFAEPTRAGVLADLRATWQRLVWTQGVLRFALPASLLMLTMRRPSEADVPVELLLLLVLAFIAALVRATRPYLTEIVLLEKNPLVARDRQAVTIATRNARLHAGGSDLISRWISSGIVAAMLLFVLLHALLLLQGMLLNDWRLTSWFMLHVGLPLVLWLIAGYMTVLRLLSYLDLRIRHEGWEVGLLLRAEAERLTGR